MKKLFVVKAQIAIWGDNKVQAANEAAKVINRLPNNVADFKITDSTYVGDHAIETYRSGYAFRKKAQQKAQQKVNDIYLDWFERLSDEEREDIHTASGCPVMDEKLLQYLKDNY